MADLRPIRLVDEAPFFLGVVVVTPAARTLAGSARELVIEPRVMQVLITLNRQRGAVVGRETLIEGCWDGRVVGEDAINRAILKLRRALAATGGSATVETVAKVGYRLIVSEPALLIPAQETAARRGRRGRSLVTAAAAIAVLSGVGALVLNSRRVEEQTRIVQVEPLRVAAGDHAAFRLAQDFTSDLSNAVLGHDGKLEFAEAQGLRQRTTAFTVTGSVATIARNLHAVVAIGGGGDTTILWSHDYTAPLADVAGLRQQVSTNIAAVLVCALGTRGVPDKIDRRATSLYLEACNLHSGDQRQVAYLLRQVTARAPQFAGGWADLAVSLALASEDISGVEQTAMHREAAEAARLALSLDPHAGNAFYARALLLPGLPNWITREQIVRAGLAAEPDNPQLYDRLADDLAAIGRQQESIAASQRAVALDPLFPGKAADLVHLLANAGELTEANEAFHRMREIWPNNPYTWDARFATAARTGDPREALTLLDDPQNPISRKGESSGWRAFLGARVAPDKRNVGRALAALNLERRKGKVSDAQIVMDLVILRHTEEALDIALRMPVQSDSEFWFRSFLRPLRADPRFMKIARKQGLFSIWRATGRWPDYCSEPSLPYHCRYLAR